MRRDINDFKKQVESAYDKESKERNILVGQISELQKQTMKVSADAVSLANALRGDNKTQGNWGEFVLERLLEDAGLTKGREYQVQTSLKMRKIIEEILMWLSICLRVEILLLIQK